MGVERGVVNSEEGLKRWPCPRVSKTKVMKDLCKDTSYVQCPADLIFGECAVKEVSTKFFQFGNVGKQITQYDWIVQSPFSISPNSGHLLPGEVVSASCSFIPEKACPYDAEALFITGAGETLKTRLCGTGKYYFLHISPPGATLEFGNVVVGSAQQSSFHVINTSTVLARVCISLDEGHTQPFARVFTINPVESLIQPNERLSIKEIMEEGWMEAQADAPKAFLFEQYQGQQKGVREIGMSYNSSGIVLQERPHLRPHVDEFELAKLMLEFMLFDVLRGLHDESQGLLIQNS